ncbi:hypothetical protein J4Q44_G00196590 [Coregonus suidteri]|uniref:Uncharacterized protein n=1 Tax=Coregonus suidteri TaxID=861788 RepID=A0AAN8LCP2_9TELE
MVGHHSEGKEAGEPKEKKWKSLLENEEDGVDETWRMVWMRPEKGSDAVLEVFSVLPEDEVERVMAKKLKRAKKKARHSLSLSSPVRVVRFRSWTCHQEPSWTLLTPITELCGPSVCLLIRGG